jgi:hypothetical protein
LGCKYKNNYNISCIVAEIIFNYLLTIKKAQYFYQAFSQVLLFD